MDSASEAPWVRVATIGAAHGLRGMAKLVVHTDLPAERFVVGARFDTAAGALELSQVNQRPDGWYVSFTGHPDRNAVERLRGLELRAQPVPEPQAYYTSDLQDLQVRDTSGQVRGTVSGWEPYPAQDVLLVAAAGTTIRIPFVTALVPEVNLAEGYLVVDSGLLDTPEGS